MKHLVLLIDGMADHGHESLGGKTPMMVAKIHQMRALCQKSIFGKVRTIPHGMAATSDVGNLALLGYDPQVFHRGRGPLEALNMGLKLKAKDRVMRCNLICLSNGSSFDKNLILDSGGGGIGSIEGRRLMTDLLKACPPPVGEILVNEGYKHLLYLEKSLPVRDALGAHEYLHRSIESLSIDTLWLDYYRDVHKFLDRHPINVKRAQLGLKKANGLWFWGKGRAYDLQDFKQKNKLDPAMVATSSLMLGMAKAMNIKVYSLDPTLKNNFDAYITYIFKALDSDHDYIYIHLEGVDEASHEGDLEKKIKLLEKIDAALLGPLCLGLEARHMPYRLMVATDHASPVALRKHTGEPVPYFIYDSTKVHSGTLNFSESLNEKGQKNFDYGTELFNYFIKGQ